MPHITPASEMLRDSDLLRASPVQMRSNLRLTALLDAAAKIIHKSGYEELTTADVAKEAGASIGTVYRYFEDRVVLLRALATRNFERTTVSYMDALALRRPSTIAEAVEVTFDMYLGLFRNEKGFRSLRLGDVLDIRPRKDKTYSRLSAETLANYLSSNHNVSVSDELLNQLEINFVIVDALLARAFAESETGDETFIAAARNAARIAVH